MKEAYRNRYYPFQEGCYITDIRRGAGEKNKFVYATLRGPTGEVIITGTLEYIYKRLTQALPD